jgi:hypothetical protein
VLFGAELLDDVGEEVLDGFGFGLTGDDEGVVGDGGVGCMGGGLPSGFLKWRMVLSSLKKLISSTPRGWALTFLTRFLTTLSLPA